jgi:hypothetical protein
MGILMLYSTVTTRGRYPPLIRLLKIHQSIESISMDTKSGSLGTPYLSKSCTMLSGVMCSL